MGKNFTELSDISYIKSRHKLQFLQVCNINKIETRQLGVENSVVVDQLVELLNDYPMCVTDEIRVGKKRRKKILEGYYFFDIYPISNVRF